jgi:hypothetical protein
VLVPSALLALPRGVRILELNTPCAGPVLEAVQRFSLLQELRITGNGASITWCCPSADRVLPLLVQLRLDCRQPPEWDGVDWGASDVEPIPGGLSSSLVAATGLRSLDLCIWWSDDVPTLCSTLPTLLQLG